jgi:hypothetical protein
MYRRMFAVAGVIALGATLSPAAAQAAYPTDTFKVTGSGGKSSGGVIWYNQSVGVQGSVTDYAGGWGGTVVTFEFVYGADNNRIPQTRSVTSGTRDFNFVQDLPAGGATRVYVQVCSITGSACGEFQALEP